jgi:uncharacterized protein YhbP (UPF0306 family)
MDKRIIEFIGRQKAASVCCLDEKNNPYCFCIFFVFDEDNQRLYFKSSSSSNHAVYLLMNKRVAGTILPDKLNLLAIRGIQFTGFISNADPIHPAAAAYHKKIPLALAMPGDVWAIQLETIKMTDNTIGIGKKILWDRREVEQVS